TIRSNHGAQLAFVHVKIQIRDRLEAIERLVHPFRGKNEILHGLRMAGCGLGRESASGVCFKSGTTGVVLNFSAIHPPQSEINPTIPFGKNRTTSKNMPPKIISQ